MAKKLFGNLGNTKTRTLLLLGGVLVIVIVVIVIMSNRKANPLKTEESHAAKIPQITAIPGNVTSEKYQELQEEDNRRRAEQAKTTGGSAVATIIGSKDQDALSKKESFGIEGDFLKGDCKCPKEEKKQCEGAEYNKEDSAKLIADIQAKPSDSLKIIKSNPCLSKAICAQNPELAYKIIENDKELAKIMLNDCPELAKELAEKNPALFKQLMLENPELAKKISEKYPEVIKKLMTDDPEFARKMAKVNPDVVKTLMKNDPDFADQMGKQNPEMVKDLMKSDPEFAKIMAKNNPAMVKKMMLDDPEFAKAMATANPDMVKDLMKNDPAFARALAEKNPTLVKELMKNDPAFAALMEKLNPDMVKKLMADDPEFARAMAKLKNQREGTDTQKAQSIDDYRKKQKEEQANRARQVQLNEQQQKQIAALVTSMEAQSKDALTAWSEVPGQQFVAGDNSKDSHNQQSDGSGGSSGGSGSSGGAATGPVLIKAGSILFAVLDTAINTDEPGPVMATIIQGKYKGSKVIGDVQLASSGSGGGGANRPEKVILNFTTLSQDTATDEKSLSIKGVAIDPDTARTALASDVDHHYLLRYGTMFASSFMNGYAKVITAQGTVQTNSGSGTTTTTTPSLSGRQQIFAALGEVGKKFSDATSSYFTTPNTITVNSGTGFGLLILADVTASGG